MTLQTILIAAFLITIFFFLFRRWTDYLVFFPQKEENYTVTPKERGMVYEDVWLQSGKERIHGWLIRSLKPLKRKLI